MQIYFDYSFDQETDLSLREWEKIHYQNEMRELIYSAAHRMGAAAFSEGASIFYIMSSRPVLMREFYSERGISEDSVSRTADAAQPAVDRHRLR